MAEPPPFPTRGTVRESAFALVTNGFADGPAQAMRDHLLRAEAGRLVMLDHPLSAEEGDRHRLDEWVAGKKVSSRTVRLPSRPPLSYPLDLLAFPLLPRVDCWFGFNPLNVLHGIAARAIGRAGLVVYWGVDVSDDRFGRNALTAAYEGLEGFCVRRSDARFELSEAMRDARDRRHREPGDRPRPTRIVPMGGWAGLVPTTGAGAYRERRVVFVGHLLRKQGLLELLEAVRLLEDRGRPVSLDIVGRGNLEQELRERADALELEGRVRFLGFIEDHRELERMVAGGSVGAAPYATGEAASFTAYADPGKLKLYLAAGLPIVTTDAAPVAHELARAGAAVLVEFSPAAIADGLEHLLGTPAEWRHRRRAALEVATAYDWARILPAALRWIGFD
ncbi:MAG TPA: glycosyltransferase [Candidatus Dormibacteraeota bacterium]|nr:glycosyltransferase [Candidatus Dormibacteraeota bacterium]